MFRVSQFSHSVVSDSSQPYGWQHTKFSRPSSTPAACLNSCLSRWRFHPTISSSVVPFFSRLQSFPASGSFPVSPFFESGGQSIGALALLVGNKWLKDSLGTTQWWFRDSSIIGHLSPFSFLRCCIYLPYVDITCNTIWPLNIFSPLGIWRD